MADKEYQKDYMGTITWGRMQCGAPNPPVRLGNQVGFSRLSPYL